MRNHCRELSTCRGRRARGSSGTGAPRSIAAQLFRESWPPSRTRAPSAAQVAPAVDVFSDSPATPLLTRCTDVHTLKHMLNGRCRMDARKAASNLKKHRLDFT